MVPTDAAVQGSCYIADNPAEQRITLSWFDKDHSQTRLDITFRSNNKTYSIDEFNLVLNLTNATFPGIKTPNVKYEFKGSHLDNLFAVNLNESYRCNSQRKESLFAAGYTQNATVTFSDMKVESFHTKKDGKYGKEVVCLADTHASEIVPIAVGCSLAGLVIVVIVAYLIGRRRSWANKGYQTM